MVPLIFLLALLVVCGLAYYWGPDDTQNKRFTAREKSALSISLGLGFALPWAIAPYQTSLLTFVGAVAVSLLASARAGKRPFLHAYLANVIISSFWYARTWTNAQSSPDPLSLVGSVIAFVGIASFFLAIPSVIIYPFWERRRRSDRAKRSAQAQVQSAPVATTAPVPAQAITSVSAPSSPLPHDTVPTTQAVTRQ